MEHNISSGNDGAGFLVYTAQTNSAHHDNVVRYNSSTGDSRKSTRYGGITVAGRVIRSSVYGNAVDATASPVHAPALALCPGVSGLAVSGNTLRAAPGAAVIVAPGLASAAASLRQDVFNTNAVQTVTWGRRYGSVAAWHAGTDQSQLAGRLPRGCRHRQGRLATSRSDLLALPAGRAPREDRCP